MRLAFISALSLVLVGCAVETIEEIESRVDQACCGANCCLIDTVCRSVGEANPDNECEVCRRGGDGSANSWSAVPDCTPTDAGAPMADAAPAVDAGGPDAMAPMLDSGPMDDAGGPPADAGGGADSGAATDAGGGADAGDGGGGGGGCSVESGSQNVWLLAIGIVALVWRRRRLS